LNNPSILGGNIARKDADRFSYWSGCSKEIFEFRAGQKEPFAKLQKALDKYKLEEQETALPKGIFRGGWVGYFSYELGRYIEKLPETTIDDLQMPLIRLCFYDRHTTISKKLYG
jgi:para-aminobenzoate synthetase component 1